MNEFEVRIRKAANGWIVTKAETVRGPGLASLTPVTTEWICTTVQELTEQVEKIYGFERR